jgi:hypothetical protein
VVVQDLATLETFIKEKGTKSSNLNEFYVSVFNWGTHVWEEREKGVDLLKEKEKDKLKSEKSAKSKKSTKSKKSDKKDE